MKISKKLIVAGLTAFMAVPAFSANNANADSNAHLNYKQTEKITHSPGTAIPGTAIGPNKNDVKVGGDNDTVYYFNGHSIMLDGGGDILSVDGNHHPSQRKVNSIFHHYYRRHVRRARRHIVRRRTRKHVKRTHATRKRRRVNHRKYRRRYRNYYGLSRAKSLSGSSNEKS